MIGRIRYILAAGETLVALAAGWVLVFVVPFRVLTARLGGAAPPSPDTAAGDDEMVRAGHIGRRVARLAARVPWQTTCLVQAVAGWLLLKRRGIGSTIRFGVQTTETGLAAHAWLLVGGEAVLGGAVAPGYHALADLGGKPQ